MVDGFVGIAGISLVGRQCGWRDAWLTFFRGCFHHNVARAKILDATGICGNNSQIDNSFYLY
jgi:hypothetical protein